MIRVGSNKLVTPVAPTIKLDVQYPSDWFKKNQKKPPTTIRLTAPKIDIVASQVMKMINENDLRVDHVNTFLFYYCETIQNQLEDKWESYNVMIADKGDTITPLTLLDVHTIDENTNVTGSKCTERDYDWMFVYVLSIYRLIRAATQEYKNMLAARITSQLRALNPDSIAVTEVVDLYGGWQGNKTYNCLIAAIDMYFIKFEKHPMAVSRISTTGTRHRDCSGLLAYNYIKEFLGMRTLTEPMEWMFIPILGDEVERIFREGEEMTKLDSYFPYHMDLGLSQRSPYSASANPHFFDWTNLIGCMLRSPRSMNARHISETHSMVLLINAACVAYVFSHSFQFQQVFTASGESDVIDVATTELSPDELALTSTDPVDWIVLFKSGGDRMPTPLRNWLVTMGRKIEDPRPKTVDEYLKNIITTL